MNEWIPVIIYLGVAGLILILAGAFRDKLPCPYPEDAGLFAGLACAFWPLIIVVLMVFGLGALLFKSGEQIRKYINYKTAK